MVRGQSRKKEKKKQTLVALSQSSLQHFADHGDLHAFEIVHDANPLRYVKLHWQPEKWVRIKMCGFKQLQHHTSHKQNTQHSALGTQHTAQQIHNA